MLSAAKFYVSFEAARPSVRDLTFHDAVEIAAAYGEGAIIAHIVTGYGRNGMVAFADHLGSVVPVTEAPDQVKTFCQSRYPR